MAYIIIYIYIIVHIRSYTMRVQVAVSMVVGMGEAMVSYYGLEEHKDEAVEGLRRLIFYHLLQLRCNSHTVSFLGSEGEEDNHACEGLQLMLEEKLAVAVYLTTCFLNHACIPNVAFRYNIYYIINFHCSVLGISVTGI